MRNRTEEINVRVYKTEKNTIRRKAKKCGMNMSEYLRILGTGTAVKEAPRRELMLAYQKLTKSATVPRGQDDYTMKGRIR
jgi:hypothetical protein